MSGFTPTIPERRSSLMAQPVQRKLQTIKARKASAASQFSMQSDVSAFLEAKLRDLGDNLEYIETYRSGLLDIDATKMTKRELEEEIDKIECERTTWNKELLELKRRKKFIVEDMEEDISRNTVEEAYNTTVVTKVMSSGIQKPGKKFKHKAFRNKVAKRYDSERTVKGKVMAFCPLTGWHDARHTKAAHIVPRTLSSAELSYLFGVNGEVVATDPRNALILHARIEEALDMGDIVIVPCPTPKDVLTKWKLILTNPSISDQCAVAIGENLWTWDELDGRTLEFCNDERPARRYLYFRYAITYLFWKKKGLLEWTSKTSDDQGRMWATPGQYLRKSMLQVLARHISHHFLPDPVIGNNTFEAVLESPSRPTEEPLMAVQLGIDIEEHQKARAEQQKVERRGGHYVDSDEENSDEEESDEDEEDEEQEDDKKEGSQEDEVGEDEDDEDDDEEESDEESHEK